MNDARYVLIGDIPSTPIEEGIRETMERFLDFERYRSTDTSDIDADQKARRRGILNTTLSTNRL